MLLLISILYVEGNDNLQVLVVDSEFHGVERQ